MLRQDLPKFFTLYLRGIFDGECPSFGHHLRSGVRPFDASEPRLLQRKVERKGKCGGKPNCGLIGEKREREETIAPSTMPRQQRLPAEIFLIRWSWCESSEREEFGLDLPGGLG
jgi:hypothetical protein